MPLTVESLSFTWETVLSLFVIESASLEDEIRFVLLRRAVVLDSVRTIEPALLAVIEALFAVVPLDVSEST